MDENSNGSDEELGELLTYYRATALRKETATDEVAEPGLTAPDIGEIRFD